ncbi:hypothetical protein [Acinetobacter tjernbergiae]|uniref:Uncharacterized protein n=1 Tax=Acinetobacter tjernbergiae DSM 14971 = CIP 107465 TaxID=1120928 RepID=V2UFB6_9GAMM|nr:hypothetical protein [Acinetobacter tjernbergiae]ESK53428.1 hypothetical protein F990_03377 [Acinetobacter tjernbergiae DSM 14971 = CIP 107465]
MLGEIYWNNLPAKVTRIGKKDNEIFILFEGKINGYGLVQSGRIVLKMTTEFQVVHGAVEYHDESRYFDSSYVLEGNFEDDSYEMFSGNWLEEGHNYQFDILLEFDERGLPSLATELERDESIAIDIDEEIHNDQDFVNSNLNDEENRQALGYLRADANRQRATRSDARVRTIQRKIELYYGLPQGSVRLVNPDRSIIHPSAKIRTLRERWMFDE